jgi:hypothetical protein
MDRKRKKMKKFAWSVNALLKKAEIQKSEK